VFFSTKSTVFKEKFTRLGDDLAVVDGRDLSTCRLFTGYLPGYRTCTTQVELDAPHRRLWVHLASVARFSVSLGSSDVDVLAIMLAEDGAGAVRCRHEEHGGVLLGLHPHTEPGVVPYADRDFDGKLDGGPMRIYLHLDEAELNRIEITFTRAVTDTLIAHLRACRAEMAG
jgi:hypothetical protein